MWEFCYPKHNDTFDIILRLQPKSSDDCLQNLHTQISITGYEYKSYSL